MTEKIKMTTPIVEMDGDEMTRVIWQKVKDELICPFVELKTLYFDLGLKNREKTRDKVTFDAAEAAKKLGVAVKCATITPNEERVTEYSLSELWPSPNITIRACLDGTVFRAPISIKGIDPYVKSWKSPIIIARHAYGDIYKNVESKAAPGDKAYLLIEGGDGSKVKIPIHSFDGEGMVQGIHNTRSSIVSFAKSCFAYSLDLGKDLWFSAKDTISRKYDRAFRDIFNEVYESEYKEKFKEKGISYFYTLIDDAVARVVRSEGGFVWALKNYDGDVMSDMIAAASGDLAMMTSVLVSPDGVYEYEAAHGTVQRHYYNYLKGLPTTTNPAATIYAWAGGLKKRGELDGLTPLSEFGEKLERAVAETFESGFMPKGLCLISSLSEKTAVGPWELIEKIKERLVNII